MTSNIAMVTNYRFGYLDCSTKHIMLARQNVVSVFFSLFQYFKERFGLAERALDVAEPRLIYYLTIYNVQLMYYLVILYCRPLSDTRRISAEN